MSNRYNGVLPLDHRPYKDEDHKAVDAGIDALAVIDEMAGKIWRTNDSDPILALADEARAAVAELIKECDALTMTAHGHVDSVLQNRIAAVRAAIARVRGAA